MMQDFIGFTYNGKHSIRDLKIYRTNNSSRYDESVGPTMEDKTAEIPGMDGQYYLGTVFKNRTFNISFAFDQLTEADLRVIKQTFSGDGIHELVFDETPYKAWSAKVTGSVSLKHLCFSVNGKRVYKGEGTITFTCYYPYALTPTKVWWQEEKENETDEDKPITYETKDGKNTYNYKETVYTNKAEWAGPHNGVKLYNADASSWSFKTFRTVCGDRSIPYKLELTPSMTVNNPSRQIWLKERTKTTDNQGATVNSDKVIGKIFFNSQQPAIGEKLIFDTKTRLLTLEDANGNVTVIPYTYTGNPFYIHPNDKYYGWQVYPDKSDTISYYTGSADYRFEYL